MRNTKLYAVLEYFDKKEQSRLRKYLLSPYFNSNEDLVILFETVVKQLNSTKVKAFEKKEVWKKLENTKKYDDVRFRKYMSDLLKLIENFLAQEIYENSPLIRATNLLNAVETKNLTKMHNSTLRTARRLSEQIKHRDADYYYHQYLIELSYHKLTDFDNKRTNETSNEKEIIQNLDFFYFAEKLRIHSSMLSNQYLVKRDMESLFFDEVIEYVKNREFEETPAISIYFQIYLTQVEADNENHYFKLKKLLNKYYTLFPAAQAYDMYIFAMNYCIRRLNQGKPNALEELFILYKELLPKKLILVDGELSPWHFKNIIVTALRLKEYKWTEDFIGEYKNYLPEKIRENAVSFNLAQVYFYQKKYIKVSQILPMIEYEDFTYNLGSKAMLLATYFETNEIEPLYSLFESFRAFLNRHKKFPPDRRESYLNLIKFTKKLTKLKARDKKGIQKLKDDIEKNKNIASINWLLDKITELEP